jgi:hypothetical protein
MKFSSCFSHVMLLVFSLAAPQILGAQSKTAAAPATKPGVVKTNLTAQPGHGVTPVVQYYTDNDALPVSDEISRVDLEETKWKAVSEYSAVLTAERAAVAQTIASPDFDHHKMPTYQGYDRILSYMQQSLTDQMPIEQIGEDSYQRVVKESETDAVLAGMDVLVVRSFFDSLTMNLKSN